MAAPLANSNETRPPNALKEVQFLNANVTQTVAARDAAVDCISAMVGNSVELPAVDPCALAR